MFIGHTALAKTKFSIVLTGSAQSLEGLSLENGSFFESLDFNHSAFLLENNGKYILFEGGIGKQIDEQFSKDMPLWAQPFFSYDKHIPLVDQLSSNIKISEIYLSHVHWDHAGALQDLGQIPTFIDGKEKKEFELLIPSRTFMSQFANRSLKDIKWTNQSYLGFEKYYDLFGDKTAVLVPQPGHSFGSVALIIDNGNKKYFFVGDTIWSNRQLVDTSHKGCIASKMVDRNREVLEKSIKEIKDFRERHKAIIIPTHDKDIQDKLGYFPKWIE
jgi:glyoxylase-like metal-dependent hydrolase (beta-lactamase superfamily II)